jgi:hypothetical protein
VNVAPGGIQAVTPTLAGGTAAQIAAGVTCTSSNNTIATVTNACVVTGVATGVTTIVVRSVADNTVSQTIQVNVAPVTPPSLSISSVTLPQLTQQASELAGDLRQLSKTTSQLVTKLNGTLDRTEPALNDIMANARVASEKLARTAEGFERLVNSSDGGLGRSAGSSLDEFQQLAADARAASIEVRELARTLREHPSSLLREPKPSGVEIPQ